MKNLIFVLFFFLFSVTYSDNNEGYVVLMDAGSAGTRVYIYSFNWQNPLETLSELSSKKHKTGRLLICFHHHLVALSSLVNRPEEVKDLVLELLEDARKAVPVSEWEKTELSLMATAGLRQLEESDQDWLINEVRKHLDVSGFKFDSKKTRVINGKEEAFFGWMTVAIAFKTHQHHEHIRDSPRYFGALDMGGASKQISFIIRNETNSGTGLNSIGDTDNSIDQLKTCSADWFVQFPDSLRVDYVVSRSIPGLGLRSAMDEIVSLHDIDPQLVLQTQDLRVTATHPCLAKGEFLPGSIHEYDYIISGEGNFTTCLEMIRSTLLPRIEAVIDLSCIHVNRPDVFIAMDSFPKMINMLGLLDDPAGISPQHVLENGARICQKSWEQLLMDVEPTLPPYHAQRACFASAYIYFLLTDVYGLNSLEIGKFLPLFEYNEHDLTWVLGATASSILPDGSIKSLEKFRLEIAEF